MQIITKKYRAFGLAVTGLLAAAPLAAYAQDTDERTPSWQSAVMGHNITRAIDQAAINNRTTDRAAEPEPAVPSSSPIRVDMLRAAFDKAVTIRKYNPRTASATDISSRPETSLKTGEYLTVSADSLPLKQLAMRDGKQFEPVPAIFLAADANGVVHQYRLDKSIDPFFWQEAGQDFQSNLFLILSDIENPQLSRQLAAPIAVHVTGSALQKSRYDLEFDRVGPAGEQSVTLRSNARTVPVAVTIRSSPLLTNPLETVNVKVHPVPLGTRANPPRIAAFGIGSTEITIDSFGNLRDSIGMTLQSDGGVLRNPKLSLDRLGMATAKLRSGLPGVASVIIDDPRFEAAPLEIQFAWPINFLIATLIGSCLGALVLFLWKREHAVRRSIACVLFGVGITFAVFAGFDIPRLLDLPTGRTGLIMPGSLAFLAAIMIVPIYGAMVSAKS